MRACGLTGDAHHTTQPDPGGYGAIAAMNMALEQGNVPANRVVYLNAHAASTPLGDSIEQLAISKASNRLLQGPRRTLELIDIVLEAALVMAAQMLLSCGLRCCNAIAWQRRPVPL